MITALPSPAFQAVVEQATTASRSDARVLLTGESGTGKELLAGYIHDSSPYSSGPFVKAYCEALPDSLMESYLFGEEKDSFTGAISIGRGMFERAHKSTLFLDEIGDLNANLQSKLARALQLGEFNRVGGRQTIRITARVISATQCDVSKMLGQSRFREDLFHCVSGVTIRVPPLRDRPEDIPPMTQYFLEDFCARSGHGKKSFAPAVWKVFEDYSWPGNARELRQVVEHMANQAHGDRLEAADIPPELKPGDKPESRTKSRYTIQ